MQKSDSNKNNPNKNNVLVYAISNRSGGGYSVLEDFYKDCVRLNESDIQINWIFALSTQTFADSSGIKILNYPWILKGLFYRLFFNLFVVKRLIREYGIDHVVSLQNTSILGIKKPTIISFHNVLPLYKCDENILDNRVLRIKQRLLNRIIINSVRKSEATIVPGQWIKDRFVSDYGIEECRLYVSPFRLPYEGSDLVDSEDAKNDIGNTVFFYPASAYPYKNHVVILDACKKLIKKGYMNFKVIFTIGIDSCNTEKKLYDYSKDLGDVVDFRGPINRTEVMGLYRSGTLLFPSKIEADALPLIECRRSGGYMISADLPFAREAISDYPGRDFFDPNDSDRLAELMENVILNGIPAFDKYSEDYEKSCSRAEIISSVILKS